MLFWAQKRAKKWHENLHKISASDDAYLFCTYLYRVFLDAKNRSIMFSACYYLGDENSSWFSCMAIMFKAAAQRVGSSFIVAYPELSMLRVLLFNKIKICFSKFTT